MTRSFFLLPLLAAALIAPAAYAGGDDTIPPAKTTKMHKAKSKAHAKHRHHHHRADCCVVPGVVTVPACPPDFADAWLEKARLAWVGPTRCYPFQPNGFFYPMPNYHSIPKLPPSAFVESEIIGGGGK